MRYDAKLSDVWALGICLYEMFVKKVPFQGNWNLGSKELVKLQMARKYTYPSKLKASEEVRTLIVGSAKKTLNAHSRLYCILLPVHSTCFSSRTRIIASLSIAP